MVTLNRWLWRCVAVALLIAGGGIIATAPPARTPARPVLAAAVAPSTNVHIFYYPWYGNPAGLGNYLHWDQGGHVPPADIGANLYPKLGAYDSGDVATIDQHMEWIARSGAGTIVYSWWGQGSYPDNLAPRVLESASRHGIKVAWHIEPYTGRTAASTVADINYIISRYGSSPAFYRDAAHGNRSVYYVFESTRITDWSALEQVRSTALVLAQTTDLSRVAHFGGVYTYDTFAAVNAVGWSSIAAQLAANGLVWAPSVGPGYIDDRAGPGNTTPTLDRDNGATYDREWTNALATSPPWVSVTSFNEWHEGSSIEPASASPPAGFGYQTYSGAYGTTGTASETAYLDRTRHWVDQFQQATTPAPVSLRARVNNKYVVAENAGGSPLIASGTAVGTSAEFELINVSPTTIALRSRANGLLVTAENAGAAPLIANRSAVGPWETFELIRNSDGTVSLRALANGRYVCAENGGASSLIANRTAIGLWERFDLIGG